MLSIFSWTCRASVCLLWRKVCSDLLPIVEQVVLSSSCRSSLQSDGFWMWQHAQCLAGRIWSGGSRIAFDHSNLEPSLPVPPSPLRGSGEKSQAEEPLNLNSLTQKLVTPSTSHHLSAPVLCSLQKENYDDKNELSSKCRSLHVTSAYHWASGSSFAGSILPDGQNEGRRGQCRGQTRTRSVSNLAPRPWFLSSS